MELFKLRISTGSFSLLVFALVFVENADVAEGFRANLKLYFNTTADGDFLNFDTNHPNLDDYSSLLPKVQLACGLGRWRTFTNPNYLTAGPGLGSLISNQTVCNSLNATNIKSIRHYGAIETTSDALSLYEEVNFIGKEILVEGSAYAGISTPIQSISATGKSQWKLFEGQHLEGKSFCITVPLAGYNYYYLNNVSQLNFTTIGSVFKGCNILEIEDFKRQNNI